MARWLALLFVAGATLGVLSLLLPHGPQLDEQATWVAAVLGYGIRCRAAKARGGGRVALSQEAG